MRHPPGDPRHASKKAEIEREQADGKTGLVSTADVRPSAGWPMPVFIEKMGRRTRVLQGAGLAQGSDHAADVEAKAGVIGVVGKLT